MGHREDLLAGAKRCLYERGYAHTTARDIVAASGTNLASIGYHFGSKEALLTAALFEVIGEWGAELARVAATVVDPDAPVLERIERYWVQMLASFEAHRGIWMATFEVFSQIERAPAIRQAVADGLQRGRELWAGLLHDLEVATSPEQAQAVGSLYQALLSGVLVQWLVDPERAPSGHDLATALRLIHARILADDSGTE